MSRINIFFLLKLLLLLSFPLSVKGQKLVTFNGVQYRAFPHYIETNLRPYNSYRYGIRINSDFQFNGVMLPPCIGDLPDGNYVFYMTDSYMDKVRDSSGKKLWKSFYYVYATCKIVDGKKTGYARLYSRDFQDKAYDSIPYKDDLIDGEFEYNTPNMSSMEGYYDYKHKFRLNFKKGVQEGRQFHLMTNKKGDTLMTRKANMHLGLLEGPYIVSWYGKKNKKDLVTTNSGMYKNGQMEGLWIRKSGSEIYSSTFYVNDLIREENEYKDGKLFRRYVYSRDSVLKLLQIEKQELVPHIYKYWSKIYTDKDYICYRTDANGKMEYTFVYGNMARSNFYLFFGYKNMRKVRDFTVLTDSIPIKPNRWNKYASYYIYESYIVESHSSSRYDTFNFKRENEDFIYVTSFLKSVTYRKNGKAIDSSFSSNYDEVVYGKFAAEDDEEVPRGNRAYSYGKQDYKVNFISNALFGSLYGFEFIQGDYKGLSLNYEIIGGELNPGLLRVIRLPSEIGVLSLIDTMYNNGDHLSSINDVFFKNNILSSLLSENRPSSVFGKQTLMSQLLNFMTPMPVMHRTVLLNGVPYKGQIIVDIKGWRNEDKLDIDIINDSIYECEMINDYENYDCSWKQRNQFIVKLSYKAAGENRRFDWKWGDMLTYWEAEIDSGILNGNLQISEHGYWSGALRFQSNVVKNKLDGEPRFSSYSYSSNDKMVLNFDTGKLDGQVIFYGRIGIEDVLLYKKGRMNGNQMHFEGIANSRFSKLISVVNDTLHGDVWCINRRGNPSRKGTFVKSVPHGYFYTYYDDTSNGKFASRIEFDKGQLTGEMLYYNPSGVLSKSVKIPGKDINVYNTHTYFMTYPSFHRTIKYNELIKLGYTFIDSLEEILPEKANYTMNYADGSKFAEGWKNYDEAIGEWKFYRADGKSLYKTIVFKDSLVKLSDSLSFKTFGEVTAYYENGKIMFTGFATDARSRYSCESYSNMPIEDDHYLSFYDTFGNAKNINDSAYVTEYQITGVKFKEGAIVNGLKEGLWLYYDQYGNLEMFGFYKNGLKSGRWITGDLGGIHVDPYLCFLSPEEFLNWLMKYGSNLTFTEELYVKGNLIRSSVTKTIKK